MTVVVSEVLVNLLLIELPVRGLIIMYAGFMLNAQGTYSVFTILKVLVYLAKS